ncbi:hypothetical protein BGX31_010173 [Mortierella sp. GBA43]|nr:hypothetical protein BGX31_010173 [Mortierella sp. GBA43]
MVKTPSFISRCAQRVFDGHDEDKDGRVDILELRVLLSDLKANMTMMDDLTEAVNPFDTDMDYALNFDV